MTGDSEIQRIIDKMLREETQRLFMAWVEEDIATPPDWQGFTGIRGIFDEVPEFTFWSQRPKQFTPSEFNKMWDSWNEDQKFDYVLTLIT